MKRVLLITAFAALTTFAIAATAIASTSSDYLSWDEAIEAYNKGITGLPNESPHQGYQLTTRKCVVCHAVHKATAGGDLLLRSTRAGACDYCHVSTSGGYKQVYGSNPVNYGGGTQPVNYAHDYACTNCHAVHGAQTMTATPIASAILRDLSSVTTTVSSMSNQLYRVANAPTAWKTASGNRNQPITWFCTQCHQYYTGTTTNTVTQYRRINSGPQAGEYTTATAAVHPMVADGAFNYASGGGRGTSVSNSADVAFAGAEYCRSCHDAGTDGSNSTTVTGAAFPHYTQNYVRFMTAGSSAIDTGHASATVSSTVPPAQASQWDGMCLKCHRGSATTGVGFDY